VSQRSAAPRPSGDPGSRRGADVGWLADVLPAPPARVLDAGCGDGALSAWLAGLGYQVTAIDADPAAVAAARSAGVPAVRANLARYGDEPFDVVVMLLTLHHMHPLAAVLDRVARLLRPGGLLVLDEFAWDWADLATIRWFDDIAAILAAAGVADPSAGPLAPADPPGGADLASRWRVRHTEHGRPCNRGEAMIAEVAARFADVNVRRVPYLARHLVDQRAHPQVYAALSRIEREHIADGTLLAIGFHLTARGKP